MRRGEILSLKERDYVALARVAGCGTATIFRRHLLPNIMNTLLVLASFCREWRENPPTPVDPRKGLADGVGLLEQVVSELPE